MLGSLRGEDAEAAEQRESRQGVPSGSADVPSRVDRGFHVGTERVLLAARLDAILVERDPADAQDRSAGDLCRLRDFDEPFVGLGYPTLIVLARPFEVAAPLHYGGAP